MIILLLLFSSAYAHMPTFGDCHIEDTVTKSWGAYADVKDAYSCTMNVPAGENISFSVNVPAHVTEYDLRVTLFGHGAANIECDPDFGGWGEKPAWRKLDAGLDSTKNIPVQNKTSMVFEPFGVSGYRAVAACQGRAVVGDDLFNLTVYNLRSESVPISIGVGMAESFSFTDLLLMSFSIARVWSWAGSHFFVLVALVAVLLYIIVASQLGKRRMASHLLSVSLIVNSVVFASQLLYLSFIGVPVNMSWLFPLSVHVALPLVVNIVILNVEGCFKVRGCVEIMWYVMLVYTYGLLWQGYCVPLVVTLVVLAPSVWRVITCKSFQR